MAGDVRGGSGLALPGRVYHLAEAENWPSIERDGLLSTSALLDRAGVYGQARDAVEHRQRPERLVLPDGSVVRDQKPIPAAALERCLRGATPAEWYHLLNARVFFWLDGDRLNRMRLALGATPPIVLALDTARLLAGYRACIDLTPINTGNARRVPATRGPATFVPYDAWLRAGWASEAEALGTRARPRGHRPVELTVAGAVPDALDLTAEIYHLDAGALFSPATPPV